MDRPRRIWLEFLTKAEDLVIDGSGRRIAVVTPDRLEEFVARDHTARIRDEEPQYPELEGGHHDRFPCPSDLMSQKVDLYVTEGREVGQAFRWTLRIDFALERRVFRSDLYLRVMQCSGLLGLAAEFRIMRVDGNQNNVILAGSKAREHEF